MFHRNSISSRKKTHFQVHKFGSICILTRYVMDPEVMIAIAAFNPFGSLATTDGQWVN